MELKNEQHSIGMRKPHIVVVTESYTQGNLARDKFYISVSSFKLHLLR